MHYAHQICLLLTPPHHASLSKRSTVTKATCTLDTAPMLEVSPYHPDKSDLAFCRPPMMLDLVELAWVVLLPLAMSMARVTPAASVAMALAALVLTIAAAVADLPET